MPRLTKQQLKKRARKREEEKSTERISPLINKGKITSELKDPRKVYQNVPKNAATKGRIRQNIKSDRGAKERFLKRVSEESIGQRVKRNVRKVVHKVRRNVKKLFKS
jgi:hypothetical protein